MRMRTSSWLVAAALLLGTPGSLLVAGQDEAMSILERCDDFHFFYEDAHMLVRSVLKDEGGAKSGFTAEIWEKGGRRLLVFTDPPDVAGMAVLVKDEETIYVYEPEFSKVRRIASHAKKQRMLGSDYTFDEMATKKLQVDYEPELLEQDEHSAVLWLSEKPGRDKAWPHVKLFVDKDRHWMASRIQYFDGDGVKRKTETRGKLEKVGGHWVPTVMTMVDHGRKHSTTNIVDEIAHDLGLEEKIFTKRYLVREE